MTALLTFLAMTLLMPTSLLAQETGPEEIPVSVRRPNAVSLELLGRGLLYSLNYDRSLSESFAIGLGYGGFTLGVTNPATGKESRATFHVVPAHVSYYFTPDSHRGFLTAGLDALFASGKLEGDRVFGGSGLAGNIGGGYEFRAASGFLFRGSGYLVIARWVIPWIGASAGWTF